MALFVNASSTVARLAGVATLSMALLMNASASAQSGPSNAELLDDFNFFVNTANIELALANARALIDRGLSPEEFLGVVEDSAQLESRFEAAYLRALRYQELEGVAAELYNLYEEGRRARSRDLDEIDRNIEMLTGNARARQLARGRLIEAGEYAVPSLLAPLMQDGDRLLQSEAQRLLIDMGRDSVKPLVAALQGVNPDVQEKICLILGSVGYEMAVPYLADLASSTSTDAVRNAAERAIRRIQGSNSTAKPVSTLYRELAETYLTESPSLTSFPGERHQLLWSFSPAVGLQPTAIYTEVYHEAMAMNLVERALTLNDGDTEAVALWLEANFSRELDQPEGYDNPAYSSARRDAQYYAVAAGSTPVQLGLSKALKARDTVMARLMIGALSDSTGGANLWRGLGNSRPLVEALTYPDRRVRYDAAMTIAAADPRVSFSGAELIVPTLASVVNDAGTRYAMVIARDVERQQQFDTVLSDLGFIVLPPVTSLAEASQFVADVPGVDIIISDIDDEPGIELIESVRNTARLAATPVIALMPFENVNRYGARYQGDDLTRIARDGIGSSEIEAAVTAVVTRASGVPMDDDEAASYSERALELLERLAVGRNTVLNVNDAASSLIGSLPVTFDQTQLDVATVLSYVNERRAQVAITDAALSASGDQQIALIRIAAESAKRHGNMLEDRQIQRVIQLADSTDSDLATAAAAFLGSLNLGGDRIVPLILGDH
ncbi:MAG: HEAT repeat domain-containing protein [Phycisphaerales bacterium JB050]